MGLNTQTKKNNGVNSTPNGVATPTLSLANEIDGRSVCLARQESPIHGGGGQQRPRSEDRPRPSDILSL